MSDAGTVCLRPVEERDLTELALIDTDPAISEPFEWRGFRDPCQRRRRWEQDGYLATDDGLLVVALPDGTFAGIVVWKAIVTSGPCGCLQIGILLFPQYRGKGLGTAAQRLLAEYLFSTTLVNRWRQRRRPTTSPSNVRWNMQDSSGRAWYAAGDSSAANGGTATCLRDCETTRHRRT